MVFATTLFGSAEVEPPVGLLAQYRSPLQGSNQRRESRMKAKPQPRNALYAQSGGVSAVINASAAGVIDGVARHKKHIRKLYAGRHGIVGALTEDLIDLSAESRATVK